MNWLAGDDDEEAPGRTMLKTYLVEAHCPGDDAMVASTLAELGTAVGFNVAPTRDSGLFRISRDDVEMWCDTSLGRFWRLHTTAPVLLADKFRDAMVGTAAWLDRVWLSPNYLEGFSEKVGAKMMTFSLNHDRRPMNPAGQLFSDSDFVSLRLWASRPGATLEKLRRAEVFPHGVSLRSVRLRSGSDEADGEYCVAEYFYHGKVTASGTSFDEHSRLVLRALQDYRNVVEEIEGRYGLAASHDESGHPLVVGNPIVMKVDWEVADLRHAVAKMFSCGEPFRLWGLPEEVGDEHYRAHAVDLHFGGVLSFDITRHHVAVQLPRSVCGNTIVRFLSSLRFHVNSDATGPA